MMSLSSRAFAASFAGMTLFAASLRIYQDVRSPSAVFVLIAAAAAATVLTFGAIARILAHEEVAEPDLAVARRRRARATAPALGVKTAARGEKNA